MCAGTGRNPAHTYHLGSVIHGNPRQTDSNQVFSSFTVSVCDILLPSCLYSRHLREFFSHSLIPKCERARIRAPCVLLLTCFSHVFVGIIGVVHRNPTVMTFWARVRPVIWLLGLLRQECIRSGRDGQTAPSFRVGCGIGFVCVYPPGNEDIPISLTKALLKMIFLFPR